MAVVISAGLTGVVRWLALRHGLLDVPNQRSSHSAPTPRGGGVAIVIASGIALTLLGSAGAMEPRLVAALLGGGITVAMIGFLDDRRRLSATVRLAVHAAAALWALLILGGVPAVQVGNHLVEFGWSGWVIGTLAIIWVLNLFNFMDGIDGIAAAEAVFVAIAGALVSSQSDTGMSTFRGAIVFGAACLGFLGWNWAPAKIFMGDVGSGFLGYVIAVLAIASARDNPTALLSWLILGGVFFCDATVTLIRRMLRGEGASQAHRTHAYQWLARRWHSHQRVTNAVLAINICWLFPWALFASKHPVLAAWSAAAALAPLLILAFFTGAGRSET
ncbi:MAG: glycosyltransferase family 4 protein [Steroidobacterales bacterium]